MNNNKELNYLNILEEYIQSKYYPIDIFNNTNYITDESYDDNMVMCYISVTEEVYDNFNTNYESLISIIKNSFNQYLNENNIDLDINDFDCTTLSDELTISLTIENENIDYSTYENKLKNIEEKWDPSMSKSPDAPWNQTSFLDEYDTELNNYLIDQLGYDEDELNDLYQQKTISDLETDVENKFEELYDSYFMDSSDEDIAVTPLYKKLEKEVTDSIGYSDYKLLRNKLKTKLFKYVFDNNLNVFKEIYDKYLKQIGYLTNEEIKQVQAGEIVKLQRPLDNTYSNINTDENGVKIGNCDGCNANGVDISNHICKTLLQDDNGNNMVTTIESFKINVLLEQDNKIKNDINGEIEYQAKSLIKKYQDQFMDEVKNIYPNYREDEYDDAINYIIDFIYDMEDIDDSLWNKIKLSIEKKLKTILL